jgi:hypothetical protein
MYRSAPHKGWRLIKQIKATSVQNGLATYFRVTTLHSIYQILHFKHFEKHKLWKSYLNSDFVQMKWFNFTF